MSASAEEREIRALVASALIKRGAAERRPALLSGIEPEIVADMTFGNISAGDQLRSDVDFVFETPNARGQPVLTIYLSNALSKLAPELAPELRGRLLAYCAARGMPLPCQELNIPAPLRHPLCDRAEQVAILEGTTTTQRRVLIVGGPAMGQRFFALRCVVESQRLLGAQLARFVPLELGDLVDVASCWCRLSGALGVDFVPDHPEMAAVDEIARLAAGGTLALVHGPVRESDGGLETLASYHTRLGVRLEERGLYGVRVVQAVEGSPARGLAGLLQRIRGVPVAAIARRPPFNQGQHTLILPELADIPEEQIRQFAEEILKYPSDKVDELLTELRKVETPDLLYEVIRKRLDEPRQPPLVRRAS